MQCFIREQKKHWSYIFVSFENDMEPTKIQDSRALVNKKWFNKDVWTKYGRFNEAKNLYKIYKNNNPWAKRINTPFCQCSYIFGYCYLMPQKHL